MSSYSYSPYMSGTLGTSPGGDGFPEPPGPNPTYGDRSLDYSTGHAGSDFTTSPVTASSRPAALGSSGGTSRYPRFPPFDRVDVNPITTSVTPPPAPTSPVGNYNSSQRGRSHHQQQFTPSHTPGSSESPGAESYRPPAARARLSSSTSDRVGSASPTSDYSSCNLATEELGTGSGQGTGSGPGSRGPGSRGPGSRGPGSAGSGVGGGGGGGEADAGDSPPAAGEGDSTPPSGDNASPTSAGGETQGNFTIYPWMKSPFGE